jgi:hypothetical protein
MEDRDKLKKDIEAVVASIFSEKEESDIRRKTELELQRAAATIEDLTSVLEEQKASHIEKDESIVKANEVIDNLKTELEAAKKEIETSNIKLTETEKALEGMKKDKLADIRMGELSVAKVLSNKETQIIKIREMSDEEFAAYRTELVEIRNAVVAELEQAKAAQEQEAAAKAAAEAAAAAAAAAAAVAGTAATEEVDGIVTTPPANIDPGDAIAAALNFEVAAIDNDILSKYSKLGISLAEGMK